MVTAAVPADEAAALARAPARTARSPVPSGAEEAAASLAALPARDHIASRMQLLAASVAAVFTGASLLHARPMSMTQARAHHHEHGGHWPTPIIKWLRVGWGYVFHLPYRAVALALDLVLSSPAATLIVAALVYAFWHWR